MKVILRSGTVKFPEGVTCTVRARIVTVKGPRGVLVQDFKHLPIDLQFTDESCTELKVDRWFTSGKAPAAIRSSMDSAMLSRSRVRPSNGALSSPLRSSSRMSKRMHGVTWKNLPIKHYQGSRAVVRWHCVC